MDAGTLVVMTTLILLLNGGVLGLVHRGLTSDVQPAAADWRIGTLLIAGASILFGAVEKLPPGLIFPAANLCVLSGVALYWRSLRRFCGMSTGWWLAVPVVAGVAAVWWFAQIHPHHGARVLVVSSIVAAIAFLSAWTLVRHGQRFAGASRNVLTVVFCVWGAISLLRVGYFSLSGNVPVNILQTQHWINLVSILAYGVMPIVGTTAFIVMCVERIRRQWETAAATDELTQLPNRRSIAATANARFNAARRAGLVEAFAVAVIDIDHFKSINDRYGHDVGDVALKHLARVLEHTCRGPNMAGRQGGEEFVVLLDVANATEARAAAERIRRAIEEAPVNLPSAPLPVTASIGVSVMSAADGDFDTLLKRADQALYAAKQGGRNRVELRQET
ncbi:MAG: GGDEF domain-containing protein [Betaproteobacteria bacterium]|nr:GGDEF domain-containing protein [Betaproteobacteria bacterium]